MPADGEWGTAPCPLAGAPAAAPNEPSPPAAPARPAGECRTAPGPAVHRPHGSPRGSAGTGVAGWRAARRRCVCRGQVGDGPRPLSPPARAAQGWVVAAFSTGASRGVSGAPPLGPRPAPGRRGLTAVGGAGFRVVRPTVCAAPGVGAGPRPHNPSVFGGAGHLVAASAPPVRETRVSCPSRVGRGTPPATAAPSLRRCRLLRPAAVPGARPLRGGPRRVGSSPG